jgi:DNA helicase HerA-like ATPase
VAEGNEVVGRVLGSFDATPLELWVGVPDGQRLQLDDLVVIETTTPDTVRFYGVVDMVRRKYEGASFDSDAFRAVAGTLPVECSYAAHVAVTRVEPELFIPPAPGDPVRVVRGEEFQKALSFDKWERKLPIGLTRALEPVYANLDFVDGTRGAHASISGISGVATKTSYASFLLYSLFHSGALGMDATNAHALVFNVKGEDLLFLDRPNAKLPPETASWYKQLGLPVGPFESVALYAPARRSHGAPVPDTGSRQAGVNPYLWTLKEFVLDKLLRFCFGDVEDGRAQLSFVLALVERALEREVQGQDAREPSIEVKGKRLTTFDELVECIEANVQEWATRAAHGTQDAFIRRLHAAGVHVGHLVRGTSDAKSRGIDWRAQRVTVVDINKLHSTAKTFVVGVLLKRMMKEKEDLGVARPLVFVLLDELNKYAPREGWSPIQEVLLDVAERGRSLGISLFGAQQTASEVERRVVSNAALRIVGRLDAAESDRSEYGFLTATTRLRARMLQPGSMIVQQPEIPTPILLRFPFPSWATRSAEAADPPSNPFSRVRK